MLKVNGKAYDWGDVDLKIPGLNIQVQEISYDDELEMEEVYGSGSKPRGYGTGNYKASGKLSMLRDDYDDLLAYCKQKGVPFYKMELPSIIVSYANEGARTKIDELKKVKFSKRSNKAAQGDKSLTVDVDMMIVGGVYQDGVAPVYWYEYKLTVIDRFGNPDANYPALPGIKSKKQFKAGAVVAVALPYGDLTPAIIGEVEL